MRSLPMSYLLRARPEMIGNGNDALVQYLCLTRTVNRSRTWNISGSQTKGGGHLAFRLQ